MSDRNDGVSPYFDENGVPVVHPLVAQVARAIGQSDLGYVLRDDTSLPFYRGFSPYVAKLPLGYNSWTRVPAARFIIEESSLRYYEKVLEASALAPWVAAYKSQRPYLNPRGDRRGWLFHLATPGGSPRRGLPLSEVGQVEGEYSMTFHAVQTPGFYEYLSQSVTRPLPLTVEDEHGRTRTDRLLLFLCGPFHMACYLRDVIWMYACPYKLPSPEWDDFDAALDVASHRGPFDPSWALVHRALDGKFGRYGFPIPPPAVFDYLAALDEVQCSTGITSLPELEALVDAPDLESDACLEIALPPDAHRPCGRLDRPIHRKRGTQ